MSEAKVLAMLTVGLPRGQHDDAAAAESGRRRGVLVMDVVRHCAAGTVGLPMAGRKEDRVVNIEGLREFESDRRALERNGLPQPPSDLPLARARPRGSLRLPAQRSLEHDFVRNIRHGG